MWFNYVLVPSVTFRRWSRRFALVAAALVSSVLVVVAFVLISDGGTDAPTLADSLEDPCTAVMGAGDGAEDPLAQAGLRGLDVSSRLLTEFPARGVSCAAGTTTSPSMHVRGVFVELRDESGPTVAVYSALHPKQNALDWQYYMRETFQTELDFRARGDGSILAIVRGQPRAAAAAAAYQDVGRTTPLWRAVGPLIAG